MKASDILNVTDNDILTVEVPEWKMNINLRSISGKERTAIDRKVKELEKTGRQGDISAYMVALCMCDEVGNRVFNDNQVDALNEKNGKVLDRLALAAASHNGIGEEAKKG